MASPSFFLFSRMGAVLLGLLGVAVAAPAPTTAAIHGAALIQLKGSPLSGGWLSGGSKRPLERAEGGDTPILTFTSAHGSVRLLLDTGASSAVVSPALVQRLRLHSRPLAADGFSLAGGGPDCRTPSLFVTRLPELWQSSEGGGPALRLVGLEALVLPVAALPPGVDGILGAPTLQQRPFLVDPFHNIVAIGKPSLQWRQSMGSPSQSIPLAWGRGVPLVPIRWRPRSGDPPQMRPALADTGAEGLFLTSRLAALLTPLGPARPARLMGVCGQQEVVRQRLMGLSLGSQTAPDQSVEAIVTDGPVFQFLGVEAIVGQEWFRSRRQLWRLDANPPRLELW